MHTEGLVFLLEALAHGLEGDIVLDFALSEEPNAGLVLNGFPLLAFAECTLYSAIWLTI